MTRRGYTLPTITDAEKTQYRNLQCQWIVKYMPRASGQGACLKGMSRRITMQDFTLTAISDSQVHSIVDRCTHGQMKIWTHIWHSAISRSVIFFLFVLFVFTSLSTIFQSCSDRATASRYSSRESYFDVSCSMTQSCTSGIQTKDL